MVIEKSIVLEMAHRLPHHQGRCRNIHGHSWKLSVAIRGPIKRGRIPDDGMVADFILLKSALKMIEDDFDHTIVLADYDPLVIALGNIMVPEEGRPYKQVDWGVRTLSRFGWINILRDMPPTSENLTAIWKDLLVVSLPGQTIASVSVMETATSECIWVPEEE